MTKKSQKETVRLRRAEPALFVGDVPPIAEHAPWYLTPRKCLALFLSICQILISSPAYPAEIPKTEIRTFPGIQVELKIPPKLGALEEFHTAECPGTLPENQCSAKTVIYIQDAHDSLEAQENISKLIHRLAAKYGVTTVLEEGYEGTVPTDYYFGEIKDAKIRQKAAYFLMDKLRLGGAEYAHITRRKDFKLVGADSLRLHQKNIESYQASVKHQKETADDLESIDSELRKMTQLYFTRELKEWMGIKEKLDRKEIDLLDYLQRTQRLFLKGIGFEEFRTAYPNISLLLSAAETRDRNLLGKLKTSVDYKSLFREINRLEDDYAQSYLTQDRDRQVFHYYKLVQLLKRLNAIEVTEEEYSAVKNSLRKMKTEEIAGFIAAETHQSLVLSKLWEKNIQSAVQFYELTRERDGSIQSRLKDYRESPDTSPIVLVYGGFHKGSIKALLQKDGFSFAVVAPKITSASPKHQRYYQQLMSMGYGNTALPKMLATAASPPRFFNLAALSPKSEMRMQSQLKAIARAASSVEMDTVEKIDLVLEHQVRRAFLRSEVRADEHTPNDETHQVAERRASGGFFKTWPEREEEIERDFVTRAMIKAKGHQTLAAAFLNINRNTLHKKITDYGIEIPSTYTAEDNILVTDEELFLDKAKDKALKLIIEDALRLTGETKKEAARLLGINRATLDKVSKRLGVVYSRAPALGADGAQVLPFKTRAEREAEIERDFVIRAMDRAKGNQTLAAEFLNIDTATLAKKLRIYGIQIPRTYKRGDDIQVTDDGLYLEEARDRVFKQALEEALVAASGVQSKAAELLGVHRNVLSENLERFGIVYSAGRRSAEALSPMTQHEKDYVAYVLAWAEGDHDQTAEILGWSAQKLNHYLKLHESEMVLPLLDKEQKLQKPPTMEVFYRAYLISAFIFNRFDKFKTAQDCGVSLAVFDNALKQSQWSAAAESSLEDTLLHYGPEIKLALHPEEIRELFSRSKDRMLNHSLIRLRKEFGATALTDVYLFIRENQAAAVDALQKGIRDAHQLKLPADFAARTQLLKERFRAGTPLDALLPEAFAVFKEAAKAAIQQEPSYEQVLAAIAIHQGMAVEMEPGEGKTLSIALAAYLNALTGKGVHLHTFNNYLAIRDSQAMGAVFHFLGMTVGVRVESSKSYLYDPKTQPQGRKPGYYNLASTKAVMNSSNKPITSRDAYQADITYGVKEQFVFDFLNDQRLGSLDVGAQRREGPALTVVDEGDSVMLDEANEPLILSGPAEARPDDLTAIDYTRLYRAVLQLNESADYEIDSKNESVTVQDTAVEKIYEELQATDFPKRKLEELKFNYELKNMIHQALLVKYFNRRDSDYIVRNGRVVLVDEFTGRLKEDHVLGNHRHQLIAAKEAQEGHSVAIEPESRILGIMTYQNYYRLIGETSTLSMITGTMGNDAPEILQLYHLDFVRIPLQFPSRLIEHEPVVTETKQEKDVQMIEKIKEIHSRGNPILVFVRRISDAHQLKSLIEQTTGLSAEVIDGINLTKELTVISQAGKKEGITIATNVVGRGVNIETDEEVEKLGGLIVFMTRRNKSRRIDLQSMLRTARRGKSGEVYWYLSREDESHRRFGVQAHSEFYLRNMRSKTLFYDDEIDAYRRFFYEARRRLLELTSRKGPLMRKGIFLRVDSVWENYLQELQFYKFRNTPDNYVRVSRENMDQVREVLRQAFHKEHQTEAFQSIEAAYGWTRSEVRMSSFASLGDITTALAEFEAREEAFSQGRDTTLPEEVQTYLDAAHQDWKKKKAGEEIEALFDRLSSLHKRLKVNPQTAISSAVPAAPVSAPSSYLAVDAAGRLQVQQTETSALWGPLDAPATTALLLNRLGRLGAQETDGKIAFELNEDGREFFWDMIKNNLAAHLGSEVDNFGSNIIRPESFILTQQVRAGGKQVRIPTGILFAMRDNVLVLDLLELMDLSGKKWPHVQNARVAFSKTAAQIASRAYPGTQYAGAYRFSRLTQKSIDEEESHWLTHAEAIAAGIQPPRHLSLFYIQDQADIAVIMPPYEKNASEDFQRLLFQLKQHFPNYFKKKIIVGGVGTGVDALMALQFGAIALEGSDYYRVAQIVAEMNIAFARETGQISSDVPVNILKMSGVPSGDGELLLINLPGISLSKIPYGRTSISAKSVSRMGSLVLHPDDAAVIFRQIADFLRGASGRNALIRLDITEMLPQQIRHAIEDLNADANALAEFYQQVYSGYIGKFLAPYGLSIRNYLGGDFFELQLSRSEVRAIPKDLESLMPAVETHVFQSSSPLERTTVLHLSKKEFAEHFKEGTRNQEALRAALVKNYERRPNQRSIYFDLPDPFEINGRRWMRLQLKGIVFDSRGELAAHSEAVYESLGKGEHAKGFVEDRLEVFPDGRIRNVGAQPSPDGAMTLDKAIREFALAESINANANLTTEHLFAPGAVAYGEFSGFFFDGQPLGFVVLAMDDEMVGAVSRSDENGATVAADTAHALHLLHQEGYSHPFLHGGNLSANVGRTKWYVHDLDAARFFNPNEDTLRFATAAQVRDFFYLLEHYVLDRYLSNDHPQAAEMGFFTLESLLAAYFPNLKRDGPIWRSLTGYLISAKSDRVDGGIVEVLEHYLWQLDKPGKSVSQKEMIYPIGLSHILPAAAELMALVQRSLLKKGFNDLPRRSEVRARNIWPEGKSNEDFARETLEAWKKDWIPEGHPIQGLKAYNSLAGKLINFDFLDKDGRRLKKNGNLSYLHISPGEDGNVESILSGGLPEIDPQSMFRGLFYWLQSKGVKRVRMSVVNAPFFESIMADWNANRKTSEALPVTLSGNPVFIHFDLEHLDLRPSIRSSEALSAAKVSDVSPIWMPMAQPVLKESDLDRLVEEPLREAAKILFRKRIQTVSASASSVTFHLAAMNQKYLAHLAIDTESLSDINRVKLAEIEKTFKVWKYGEILLKKDTGLGWAFIYFEVTPKTTVAELEAEAKKIADFFENNSQDGARHQVEGQPAGRMGVTSGEPSTSLTRQPLEEANDRVFAVAEALVNDRSLAFMPGDEPVVAQTMFESYAKLNALAHKEPAEIFEIFRQALTTFWQTCQGIMDPGAHFDSYWAATVRQAADQYLHYEMEASPALPESMPVEEQAMLHIRMLEYAALANDYEFHGVSAWINELQDQGRDTAPHPMSASMSIGDLDDKAQELLSKGQTINAAFNVIELVWGKGIDGQGDERERTERDQIRDYISHAKAFAVGPKNPDQIENDDGHATRSEVRNVGDDTVSTIKPFYGFGTEGSYREGFYQRMESAVADLMTQKTKTTFFGLQHSLWPGSPSEEVLLKMAVVQNLMTDTYPPFTERYQIVLVEGSPQNPYFLHQEGADFVLAMPWPGPQKQKIILTHQLFDRLQPETLAVIFEYQGNYAYELDRAVNGRKTETVARYRQELHTSLLALVKAELERSVDSEVVSRYASQKAAAKILLLEAKYPDRDNHWYLNKEQVEDAEIRKSDWLKEPQNMRISQLLDEAKIPMNDRVKILKQMQRMQTSPESLAEYAGFITQQLEAVIRWKNENQRIPVISAEQVDVRQGQPIYQSKAMDGYWSFGDHDDLTRIQMDDAQTVPVFVGHNHILLYPMLKILGIQGPLAVINKDYHDDLGGTPYAYETLTPNLQQVWDYTHGSGRMHEGGVFSTLTREAGLTDLYWIPTEWFRTFADMDLLGSEYVLREGEVKGVHYGPTGLGAGVPIYGEDAPRIKSYGLKPVNSQSLTDQAPLAALRYHLVPQGALNVISWPADKSYVLSIDLDALNGLPAYQFEEEILRFVQQIKKTGIVFKAVFITPSKDYMIYNQTQSYWKELTHFTLRELQTSGILSLQRSEVRSLDITQPNEDDALAREYESMQTFEAEAEVQRQKHASSPKAFLLKPRDPAAERQQLESKFRDVVFIRDWIGVQFLTLMTNAKQPADWKTLERPVSKTYPAQGALDVIQLATLAKGDVSVDFLFRVENNKVMLELRNAETHRSLSRAIASDFIRKRFTSEGQTLIRQLVIGKPVDTVVKEVKAGRSEVRQPWEAPGTLEFEESIYRFWQALVSNDEKTMVDSIAQWHVNGNLPAYHFLNEETWNRMEFRNARYRITGANQFAANKGEIVAKVADRLRQLRYPGLKEAEISALGYAVQNILQHVLSRPQGDPEASRGVILVFDPKPESPPAEKELYIYILDSGTGMPVQSVFEDHFRAGTTGFGSDLKTLQASALDLIYESWGQRYQAGVGMASSGLTQPRDGGTLVAMRISPKVSRSEVRNHGQKDDAPSPRIVAPPLKQAIGVQKAGALSMDARMPIWYFLKAFGFDPQSAKVIPDSGSPEWGHVLPLTGKEARQNTRQSALRVMVSEKFMSLKMLRPVIDKILESPETDSLSQFYLLTYQNVPAALVWPLPDHRAVLYYPFLTHANGNFFKTVLQQSAAGKDLKMEIDRYIKRQHGRPAFDVIDNPYYDDSPTVYLTLHQGLDPREGMSFSSIYIPGETSTQTLLSFFDQIDFEGKSVVEIGSGNGRVIVDAAQRGALLAIGYETSELGVQNTLAWAALEGVQNIQVLRDLFSADYLAADIYLLNAPNVIKGDTSTEMSFNSQTFEKARLINVEITQGDFREVMKKISRAMRSNSTLYLRIGSSEAELAGYLNGTGLRILKKMELKKTASSGNDADKLGREKMQGFVYQLARSEVRVEIRQDGARHYLGGQKEDVRSEVRINNVQKEVSKWKSPLWGIDEIKQVLHEYAQNKIIDWLRLEASLVKLEDSQKMELSQWIEKEETIFKDLPAGTWPQLLRDRFYDFRIRGILNPDKRITGWGEDYFRYFSAGELWQGLFSRFTDPGFREKFLRFRVQIRKTSNEERRFLDRLKSIEGLQGHGFANAYISGHAASGDYPYYNHPYELRDHWAMLNIMLEGFQKGEFGLFDQGRHDAWSLSSAWREEDDENPIHPATYGPYYGIPEITGNFKADLNKENMIFVVPGDDDVQFLKAGLEEAVRLGKINLERAQEQLRRVMTRDQALKLPREEFLRIFDFQQEWNNGLRIEVADSHPKSEVRTEKTGKRPAASRQAGGESHVNEDASGALGIDVPIAEVRARETNDIERSEERQPLNQIIEKAGPTKVFVDASEPVASPEQTAGELSRLAKAGAQVVIYNLAKAPSDNELVKLIETFPKTLFHFVTGSWSDALAGSEHAPDEMNLIHYSESESKAKSQAPAWAGKRVVYLAGKSGSAAYGLSQVKVLRRAVEAEEIKESLLAQLEIAEKKGFYFVSEAKSAWMSLQLEAESVVAFAQAA